MSSIRCADAPMDVKQNAEPPKQPDINIGETQAAEEHTTKQMQDMQPAEPKRQLCPAPAPADNMPVQT